MHPDHNAGDHFATSNQFRQRFEYGVKDVGRHPSAAVVEHSTILVAFHHHMSIVRNAHNILETKLLELRWSATYYAFCWQQEPNDIILLICDTNIFILGRLPKNRFESNLFAILTFFAKSRRR
jgi:hypothetical protein